MFMRASLSSVLSSSGDALLRLNECLNFKRTGVQLLLIGVNAKAEGRSDTCSPKSIFVRSILLLEPDTMNNDVISAVPLSQVQIPMSNVRSELR